MLCAEWEQTCNYTVRLAVFITKLVVMVSQHLHEFAFSGAQWNNTVILYNCYCLFDLIVI